VTQLDISLSRVEWVSPPIIAPRTPQSGPSLRVVRSADRSPAWSEVVSDAEEACLLLDVDGVVTAVSDAFLVLTGIPDRSAVVGRGLLDDILDLIDFSASGARLTESDLDRIPPLQSLRSGTLARGLVRICAEGAVRTMDAVTTPIRERGELAGSLTFFVRI
jgi:PAS domain-containing protein